MAMFNCYVSSPEGNHRISRAMWESFFLVQRNGSNGCPNQTIANQKRQDEDIQTHANTSHVYTQNKLAPVKNVYRYSRGKKPPRQPFQPPSYVPTHSTRAQQGPNNRLQGVLVQVVNFDGFHFHQQVCHLSICENI